MAEISEQDQRIMQLKLRDKKLRHLERGIEDLKTNSGDFAELTRQLAEGKKAKSDKRSAGEVKRLKRRKRSITDIKPAGDSEKPNYYIDEKGRYVNRKKEKRKASGRRKSKDSAVTQEDISTTREGTHTENETDRVLLRKKDKGYTADRRKGIYVNEEYKDKRKGDFAELARQLAEGKKAKSDKRSAGDFAELARQLAEGKKAKSDKRSAGEVKRLKRRKRSITDIKSAGDSEKPNYYIDEKGRYVNRKKEKRKASGRRKSKDSAVIQEDISTTREGTHTENETDRVLLRKKDKGYTADRRKGIYVNEEYKDKRKAIYVERTMASHSGDDERTPLLGNEGVKPIMDQIKRLRKEEDDLLVQSDALSASAAAFQKTVKKPSLWERICCCCCSGSDKDDT